MACAVYCLLTCPDEQLAPLVDRLHDAGVETADIAVVLRSEAPSRPWSPIVPTALLVPVLTAFVFSLWCWPCFLAWQWPAGRICRAMCDWPPAMSADVPPSVVPLAQYRRGAAGKPRHSNR